VSDQDYDFLQQWLWTYAFSHKGGNLIYARRSVRSGGSNVTILMHHVVLELAGKPRPSDEHTAHHRDGDGLNNRRANLAWRTGTEQMLANRIRYAKLRAIVAMVPDYVPLPDVPF